jgi:hypothetical protein
MKKMRRQKLLVLAGATAVAALGANVAIAAHKPINLFTFEELAMQFGQTKLPVAVDANGKGMPYSPKQSCGTPGQFADGTANACHDYGKIAGHSFHANQGVSEIKDLKAGDNMGNDPLTGLPVVIARDGQFNPIRNKPWTTSVGMIGKW